MEGRARLSRRRQQTLKLERTWKKSIIQSLPVTYRNSGRVLLDFFKEHCIGFDDRNQLVINGDTLPGTQITDLVHDLIRFRQSMDPPPGFYQLAETLAKLNVSRELIKNLQRQTYIMKLREGTHRGVPDSPEMERSLESAPQPELPRKRKLNHASANAVPQKKKRAWLSY